MGRPIPLLAGTYTDRLYDASRILVLSRSGSNLIVYGALDLIGSLLCNAAGAAPIQWYAVGSGNAAWDTAPPTPVRATTGLTAEVFRTPLTPGDISYDPQAKALTLELRLGPNDAVGPLREFGVFGGQAASARPGSGTLVNYKAHPVIQKTAGQTLDRKLVFSLATGLRPGAQDLIGGLLAGTITQGISFAALGTAGPAAGDATATQLQAEGYRTALPPTALVYDHDAHAITVTAGFDVDQAVFVVAEAGLLGGNSATPAPNTGHLVSYEHPATPIDKSRPVRLTQTFRLSLSTSATVPVPALAGMTPAQASATLDAAGLGLGAAVPAPGVPGTLGTVASQSVAAATAVPADSLIDVTLVAPAMTQVPPLVGLPSAGAAAAIAAARLTAGTTTSASSTGPAGIVLATDPAAWSAVPVGAAVNLTVAVPFTTIVPDIRGRTAGAAQVLLRQADLAAADPPYTTQASSGTPGTVVSQNPAPGATAAIGSQVTLTLAAGWMVNVPDLSGKTPTDAGTSLAAAAASLLAQLGLPSQPPGLAIGSVTRQTSTAPLGTVVSQSPAAGSPTPLYGSIALVLAAAPTSVVPDVRGTAQADAIALLAAAGFTLGSLTTRMSAQPVSTVLDQAPPPGVTEPTGSAVSLVVASPVMVEVPLLAGLALDGAQEGAAARGFTLAAPVTEASTATPGTVIAQAPAAYATAPTGSAITITLASGVPSLLGLTVAAAQQALSGMDLALGQQSNQASTSTPGTIIGQNPVAGTAAAAGTAVSVVVATVPTVAVPNLAGDDQPTAQQQCAALGLVLSVGSQQVVAGTAPGKVTSQNPTAGTGVPVGTTITVTLSAAPPTVVVPNVIGQTLAQATGALSAAKLSVTQGPTVPTTTVSLGIVMGQSPAAASPVAAGSTVTVNLSAQPQGMGVPVPEIRNQPLTTAEATIRAAGLNLSVTATVTRPGVIELTVITQEPAPPTLVPPGTTISVTVARPPIILPSPPDGPRPGPGLPKILQ